jgi:hypothetical protein
MLRALRPVCAILLLDQIADFLVSTHTSPALWRSVKFFIFQWVITLLFLRRLSWSRSRLIGDLAVG